MGVAGWYQFKLFLEHGSGISMDALHVIVGFAVFLLAAAALKRGLASPWPILALFIFELTNEAYDLSVEQWPDPGMQYGEGAKDILLTIFLPTIVFALARWKPRLLLEHREPDDS